MTEPEHVYRERAGKPASKDEHGRQHPHLRRHLYAGVCKSCGANEHVHEGLCRRCRKVLIGQGEVLAPGHEERPHQADDEPLHSPPWRRRGA